MRDSRAGSPRNWVAARAVRPASVLPLVSLLAGLLVACGAGNVPQAQEVKLGAVRAAYYLPFFVVKDQRLLEKRGIVAELQEYERNTTMLNAFLTGEIAVTAQSSLTMFPLEARYPNRFKFIYAQYNRSYVFLVPPESTIQSLRELEGKCVVTWTSPTATESVKLSLSPTVRDVGLVKIQQVPISLLADPFGIEGLEDCEPPHAAFSTDVYVGRAVRQNTARVLVERPLAEYVADPFFSGGGFISPRFAADEPLVAEKIQAAFEEAINFIDRNEEEARRILAKNLEGITEEDTMLSPLDHFAPIERVDVEHVQRLADRLYDKGSLQTRISVDSLLLRRAGSQ